MEADKATKKWLKKMGPYIHVTLYHHHEMTAKANQIEPPSDDILVTFEWPNGEEYNIKYGKLKEFAKLEQEKLTQSTNGNEPKTME